MIRSLNEYYNNAVKQKRIGELYSALVSLSFELKIDPEQLLKELLEIDKSLREVESK